jgi:hypothetical protein
MTSSQASITQNSVKDISLINNFFYQYEYESTNKKVSTPGYVSTNIKDTNEKALQRALLMQGTSLLDGKEVKWLDIELPIEFTDNSRRKCVDLIGKDNDGQLYLCELKFSGNSDTPRDADLNFWNTLN